MRNLDFSTKVFRLLMLVLLLFSVQISRADEGWPRTLKGRIVDAKSGETLIGVNIQILGTTTGTISDFDGGFQLVVKANSVIQFSYVGYKPIEIKAEEAVKNTVFQMEEDAGVLEEVVVVGYGTQKKVTSVGSITQADGNKLLRGGSVNSVTEALQGKLNGVVAINSGGMPGGNDVSMYIRGKSTWGNTDPLVLLDGIQSDIKDVDMNEIESISVLKDASATAVYGVRGGIGQLNIREIPALESRQLNHWNDLNGYIERGYAGKSLWKWEELPDKVDVRYTDYARANASIGINGVV